MKTDTKEKKPGPFMTLIMGMCGGVVILSALFMCFHDGPDVNQLKDEVAYLQDTNARIKLMLAQPGTGWALAPGFVSGDFVFTGPSFDRLADAYNTTTPRPDFGMMIDAFISSQEAYSRYRLAVLRSAETFRKDKAMNNGKHPWIGCKGEDTLTGTKGLIVARIEYAASCDRFELDVLDKEGIRTGSAWFDVPRLRVDESTPRIELPTE